MAPSREHSPAAGRSGPSASSHRPIPPPTSSPSSSLSSHHHASHGETSSTVMHARRPARYGQADGLLARNGLIAGTSAVSRAGAGSSDKGRTAPRAPQETWTAPNFYAESLSSASSSSSSSRSARDAVPTRRRAAVADLSAFPHTSSPAPAAPSKAQPARSQPSASSTIYRSSSPSPSVSSTSSATAAAARHLASSSSTSIEASGAAVPPPQQQQQGKAFAQLFHATRSRMCRSFARSAAAAAAAAAAASPPNAAPSARQQEKLAAAPTPSVSVTDARRRSSAVASAGANARASISAVASSSSASLPTAAADAPTRNSIGRERPATNGSIRSNSSYKAPASDYSGGSISSSASAHGSGSAGPASSGLPQTMRRRPATADEAISAESGRNAVGKFSSPSSTTPSRGLRGLFGRQSGADSTPATVGGRVRPSTADAILAQSSSPAMSQSQVLVPSRLQITTSASTDSQSSGSRSGGSNVYGRGGAASASNPGSGTSSLSAGSPSVQTRRAAVRGDPNALNLELRNGLESYSLVSASRAAARSAAPGPSPSSSTYTALSTLANPNAAAPQPPLTPTKVDPLSTGGSPGGTRVAPGTSGEQGEDYGFPGKQAKLSVNRHRHSHRPHTADVAPIPSTSSNAISSPSSAAPTCSHAHSHRLRHRHSFSHCDHHSSSHGNRPCSGGGLRPGTGSRSQTKTRRQLIAILEQWDFSTESLTEADLVNACSLIFEAALTMPETCDAGGRAATMTAPTIGKALDINMSTIRGLLHAVPRLYEDSIAYHNFRHAADVLQGIYFFLVEIGAAPSLRQALLVNEQAEKGLEQRRSTLVPNTLPSSPVFDASRSPLQPADTLALLFAAIGHDAGHPGFNNAFLVNAKTPIAKAFANESPLENYHALLLEETMTKLGFKSTLRKVDGARTQFGKLIHDCILATDMALHFGFINALDNLAARFDSGNAASVRSMSREDITLLCSALLKCSDICNPVREIGIGRQWSVNLRREWARQMDLEVSCRLPVTVGCSSATPRGPGAVMPCSPTATTASVHDCMVRRTSAAQAIASIGGGGGSQAVMSDLIASTEREESLGEELALAKGQVGFVHLFVLPLFTKVANLLPRFIRLRKVLEKNHEQWSERLKRLEERARMRSATPEPPPACIEAFLLEERLRTAAIFLPPHHAEDVLTKDDALEIVLLHVKTTAAEACIAQMSAMDDIDSSSSDGGETPEFTAAARRESTASAAAFLSEGSRTSSAVHSPSFIDPSIISVEPHMPRISRPASLASLSTRGSSVSHASLPGTIFSAVSGTSTTATSFLPSSCDHHTNGAGIEEESKEHLPSVAALSMTKVTPSTSSSGAPRGEQTQTAATPIPHFSRDVFATPPLAIDQEQALLDKLAQKDAHLKERRRFSSISLLGRRPLLKRVSSNHDRKPSSPSCGQRIATHGIIAPLQCSIRRVSFPWLYGSSTSDPAVGCENNTPHKLFSAGGSGAIYTPI